jgi:single-stranded-DNA-specific exonuclease
MFRTPDIEKACDTDAVVDLVFEATNETWQGHTKAKLMVKDILYRDGDLKDIPEKIFVESQAELDDEERAGQDLRSELAGLDEHALSDRLVAELGGKKVLSKAQKETLECLAAGSSMLCVSTQGFSSSLISCVHAAREAIRDGKASIFSYPLRDIAEAHFHHLSSCLAPLGISVASLNGKSDVSMQAKFYSELADGSCDILVTTQEFLDLHAEQFRTTGGVGFVMAELSGCAGQASTPVGDKLSKTLVALGQPTALIICEPSSARELKRQLDFDETDLASVGPKKRSLSVHDCRGLQGRDDILASIVARGEKCIVYVRSRAESVSLARRLRHVVADFTDRITSYDEGLSRYESGRVEQAFRAGRLRCVVSPVAFAEGLAIADIRHVVIYELPFGRTEFDHIEAQAGRDGLPATIWPLFGRSDVVANERLLADEAPTRADLVVLYRILRRLGQGQDGDIIATDQEIASLVGSEPRQHTPSVSSVTTGVNIFSELGFLSVSGHGSSRLISMESSPQPMHLEDSALYAEGMRAKREFTDFKEWAFNCEGDKLLEHITGPVAPDLRQAADVEVRTS